MIAELITADLPSILKRTAEQYPQHVAIRFMGRDTNFATFDALSDRVAGNLAASGIEKGDRVALYCINSDVFALAYFGIVKAGASVVPLNLLYKPNELEYILNDAEVKGLIYHEMFGPSVATFRSKVPSLKTVVCIGEKRADSNDLPWHDVLLPVAAPTLPEFDVKNDVVSVLYTSGTTGKPKGAMLTHYNLANNTRSIVEAMRFEPGREVLLVVLPMFHSFAATAGMLTPLLHGLTFLPVPKFDRQLVAETIAQGQATIFLGVPSMFNALLSLTEVDSEKLKTLRYCVAGGASMPVELMKRFEARFGLAIYEGDGPTECSPVTCVNPIGGERKPGSVGQPVPRVEMSIRDADGKGVPNGEIGEICVRGPNIMKGYWKRPLETAECFFDDWFRTGDLGYRDDDNYFYIVDRIKDMIIVNGMNVYPRVIEEVLYQEPRIAEVAVVGEPNETHGEIAVAHIILRADTQATATEIRRFCSERLGTHEVPRKIFFRAELPKNAAGKVLKRELRLTGELERGVDGRAAEG